MAYTGVPHQKQFLIGKSRALARVELPDRFKSIDLPDGLQIRYCPDLHVNRGRNGLGLELLLLGDVVEAKHCRPAPSEQLHEITHDTVASVTSSWTGHWILLVGAVLYGDCCGLFSIYMARDQLLQASGDFIVSNSPALMAKAYKLGKAAIDTRSLQPFAMPPWCFRPELRTLLAGEVLDLATGARRPSQFPPFEVYECSLAEVRQRVAQMLATAVRRLQEQARETILCALSGGYDSRLNLAAATASGLPFNSYTFVKSYFYITEADRLLPPKVAASVAANHKMIRAGEADKARGAAYIEHAGGAVTTFPDGGYDHYVHRYWEQAGEGRFALDGQCYELAVNYHRKKFAPDFAANELRVFGFGITDSDFTDVERHWKYLQQTSHPFDRRDLLFWTGNINGVYARMTQEHDLFADLFFPACNREQMSLLLSVPVEEREACAFQATITAAIRPELNVFPYNPVEPLQKRVLKRVRNEILKRFG